MPPTYPSALVLSNVHNENNSIRQALRHQLQLHTSKGSMTCWLTILIQWAMPENSRPM